MYRHEIDLDRSTLPSYLDGLRLVIQRGGRSHDELSPTGIHGATMLAMNTCFIQPNYPFGLVSMPRRKFPEYDHEVQAYAYNMNPRGGTTLGMTWGVAMYATRGLGQWLLSDWKCEVTARVFVKEGNEFKYRGCVGFNEVEPFRGQATTTASTAMAEETAAMAEMGVIAVSSVGTS